MKITDLRIDGFGVWSGLHVEHLDAGVTVLYGPNEAGKTTLMQFARAMFYGFGASRIRRYLPAVHGGRPGGWLEVAGPNGRFQISRHADPDSLDQETITLTAPDGTMQGEHLLSVLLSGVDESIFNNVFAIGLHEIQELGTLDDTEAARLLYDLTSGLDRVSLVEVMRELDASRERLLSGDDRPCQVSRLLAERKKLQSEIDQQSKQTRRFVRLAAQRDRLQLDITQAEEQAGELEQRVRTIELAATLSDRWQRRQQISGELSQLGVLREAPGASPETFDRLSNLIAKRQRQRSEIKDQRQQCRDETDELVINERLWRLAPRIEALNEQTEWIASIGRQVSRLDDEARSIETELSDQHSRLGLDGQASARPVDLSPRRLRALRPAISAVRESKQALGIAEDDIATHRQTDQRLARDLDAALSARGQNDLPSALETAGELASQLRRRLQLDERIAQMSRTEADLEEQTHLALHRQIMPMWTFFALGGVFILGAVMVLVGIFLPSVSTLGWTLAILGVAGCGTAALLKWMLERGAARTIENCNKQHETLKLQSEQAADEVEQLDRQLPTGGGPLAVRLQAAERELAELEELLPLETERQAARRDGQAAELRLAHAQGDLQQAREQWALQLLDLGLPEDLTPKQVKQFAESGSQIADLQRSLDHRRAELDQRRQELSAISERIRQLAIEAGLHDTLLIDVALTDNGPNPIELVRKLNVELREQQSNVQRRDSLQRRSQQLRSRANKYSRSIDKLRRRRRTMLDEVGARDEAHYRELAQQHAQANRLKAEHDQLQTEIAAAIAGHCTEAALSKLLAHQSDGVERCWDESATRLEIAREQLKRHYEQRGQLNEQIKSLGDDRQGAHSRLALGVLEKQIDDALAQWQVYAVTSGLLEAIRDEYETDRQPETLREASDYLRRLTGGRYRRVWTPLGENVLRVDDAEGNPLDVELLSRGTREQLFLSLRLAIAGLYARRGAILPLVLDDVLVNFDADRARLAAKVLRDFAKRGHQVLLFTCHQHIEKIFKSLKADVRRLPGVEETRQQAFEDEVEEVQEILVEEPHESTDDEAIDEQDSGEIEYEEEDQEPDEERYDETEEEEAEDQELFAEDDEEDEEELEDAVSEEEEEVAEEEAFSEEHDLESAGDVEDWWDGDDAEAA